MNNIYSDLAKYMIALVSALILLFPTIKETLTPPIEYDTLMYIFFIIAFLSLFCLGLALYFVTNNPETKPEKSLGIGNILGFTSFVFLALYFILNFYSDRNAKPSIDTFILSSLNPKKGETISIQAKVTSENGDNIDYIWKYNNIQLSNKEILYWKIPDDPKVHKIELCIHDQHSDPICDDVEIDMTSKIKKDNNESNRK